ncbi:cytochrome [Mycobacterium sp. E3298]|uniref:cytochrome P450 n=1 Tax=unclassified Mycobacterium TaxID=2642494 RepID=UPI0007FF5185|nr:MULTISPECIES: cytochrome P450 [unclassified Mycobacterium]OBG67546.1 cytochrome [Mycobacterium sp. E188]OBG79598.1 cytochrome [Mycobacterium sp. E3305]OBG97026.1 cytochrome [Mycobacterium sp. E3298]OBH34872.1 cytochrome [Mycobacterium sp. E183]
MKERLHWLAMHGFIRGVATLGVRRGDLHARLIADPTVAANPVAYYDELRAAGPLVKGRVSYLTADHALAHELLRSDDFRVVMFGANLPGPLRWLEGRTRDDLLHPLRAPSLLAVEPPDHTRYRKTVSAVFTPRAVAALRDRVEQTATELLNRLAAESGASQVVDIVGRFCSQLPVAIISDILGVPEPDRRRVLEFGELAAPSLDIGLTWQQYRSVQRGLAGFSSWLDEHLSRLRRAPSDNLMSQLIQIAESGSAETYLDSNELQAIAGLVLAAGFETTVNLLGNGIRMLLDAPDRLDTLRRRPELWPNAVEEILRLESPVQLTARVALGDVELAGQRLRRGDLVLVYLAAANRDPSVFADPHRFDIERSNAGRHLAFSGGRHFCLGAALARAEGEVGLRTFFDRFPEARGAGAGSRRDTRVLRGWSSLPVALGPARSMARVDG